MAKLTNIELNGYKAFGAHQSLELRPLTILFGHNSVGKSAALRLAKVLSDAANHGTQQEFGSTVLNYRSAALRGANFDEINHNGQKSGGLHFGLSWDDGVSFDFNIKEFESRKKEGVARFRIASPSTSMEFTNIDPSGDLFEISSHPELPSVTVKFSGISPLFIYENSSLDQSLISLLNVRLREFSSCVHWISAVRAQPPRTFLLEPGTSTQIEPDGTGTAEALRASWAGGSPMASDVSDWLGAICQCTLPLASMDGNVFYNREYFPFAVMPIGGSREIAVRDVGEGVSQALPVITLCRMAARGELGPNPVLALEQPELHLHPRAGTALANGLIKCVEDGSPARHIVETHSESFLLALQIAVLEKRLKTSDVVIYWVSPSDEGASLSKIVFDDEGYPSDGWPDSVFRETLEQARRVGELRLGA
ncbi:AAA family ATPase [Brevundimonas naejangsanensis]|uniref:AAA family ATPase n=1 Tax=Brevundimonas naejangsanensis TaxID=588932 RepID=UPI003D033787